MAGGLQQRERDLAHVGPAPVPGEAPRGERGVVRPDRAVVVAERAVRRVGLGHGAHPPSRPELVSRQRVDDRLDPRLGHDAAPEEVPDVRAERIHLPLVRDRARARSTHHGRGSSRRRRSERRARRPPPRAGPPAPRRPTRGGRPRPAGASRRRRSPEPRAGAIGGSAKRPSRKRWESPESFHDWFSRPRGAPLVLDEAVAVAVAVRVDPLEGGQSRPAEPLRELPVARPAPDLRQEHEIQRCRVDGPVVAREPLLRGTAGAQLVEDLPRLGVDRGVVDPRLQRRQRLERADRELGAEEHGLEARDDRVAAEDGHEPGHARGGQVPGALAGPQPQRREVGDGLVERVTELVRRGRADAAAGATTRRTTRGRAPAPCRTCARRARDAPPRRRARRRRRCARPRRRGAPARPESGRPRSSARRRVRGRPASGRRVRRPPRGRPGLRARRSALRPAAGARVRAAGRRGRSRAA